jgi:hypothetical protein
VEEYPLLSQFKYGYPSQFLDESLDLVANSTFERKPTVYDHFGDTHDRVEYSGMRGHVVSREGVVVLSNLA